MSSYKRAWEATCSRCDHIMKSEDFTCGNCGKGNILAYSYKGGNRGFGCNVCDVSVPYDFFKCPECFSKISESKVRIKNKPCFVATAVFQNADHAVVNELRYVRDTLLMPTKAGSAFVGWYYENGPKMAAFVENKPALRLAGRMTLTPVGKVIQIGRKIVAVFNNFKRTLG